MICATVVCKESVRSVSCWIWLYFSRGEFKLTMFRLQRGIVMRSEPFLDRMAFVSAVLTIAVLAQPRGMAAQASSSGTMISMREQHDPSDDRPQSSNLTKGPFTAHFKRVDKYSPTNGGGTQVSQETFARDSEGRTYSESRLVARDGVEAVQSFYTVQIIDPVARTSTSWSSLRKEATVIQMPEPRRAIGERRQVPASETSHEPMPAGCEEQSWQWVKQLGVKLIEGVPVEGKRITTCVPAHTDKDDKARIQVVEDWGSVDLMLSILQVSDDPFIGSTKTEMTDIQFGAPAPSLFQIPAGYTIKEQ